MSNKIKQNPVSFSGPSTVPACQGVCQVGENNEITGYRTECFLQISPLPESWESLITTLSKFLPVPSHKVTSLAYCRIYKLSSPGTVAFINVCQPEAARCRPEPRTSASREYPDSLPCQVHLPHPGPPTIRLLQLGPQPSHLSPLQFSSSCHSHWCTEVPIPSKVSMGVAYREVWPLRWPGSSEGQNFHFCAPAQLKCQPQGCILTHFPPLGIWGRGPCEDPMPAPCAECGCWGIGREQKWGICWAGREE